MHDRSHSIARAAPMQAPDIVRDIERRLVANIATGATDSGRDTMHIAASEYTDPARLAAERREVFGKLPLVAGFSCEIANPGDVMTFDAAGPAIVIARGRDGKARAFLNMCMHRGARIVDTCGPRKLMTCPFHGWSYDLDGRLCALPAAGAFEGAADRRSTRLVPVPVGEWGGLVFVKAHAGEEEIDVRAWLGTMAPEIARLNLGAARPVKMDRIDVEANWKYTLNTYGESYHFASLHPTTFGPTAVTNCNLYDRFGPHYRVTFTSNAYRDLVGIDERDWPPPPPYGGSHYLFPNTIIYGAPVENGGTFLHMYRLYPGASPGRSFTLMSCYRGGDVPAETPDATIAATHDYIEMVVRTEDYAVSKEGQRNLENAPPGHQVVFGRNEIALQNVHRDIAAAIGMPYG